MCINAQRLNALKAQLGLDKLDETVAKGVSEIIAVGERMVQMLTPSERFSAAAAERLAHFDDLTGEGKLDEAYRYGHAAMKTAKQHHQEIIGQRTYAFAMVATSAEKHIEAIHDTTDRVHEEIHDMAPDMRSILSNETIKCGHPIYEADNRLMTQLIEASEHAFDVTTLNNLEHDLREIERKAAQQGVELPDPATIEPLAPLPPFNAYAPLHAGQTQTAPARASQQGPSL